MEMISSKKGDGLSMNVIVIAILALLVLVVLTLIFVKQMDKTSTQTDAICRLEDVNAKCIGPGETAPTGYRQVTNKGFTDCVSPKACYVPPTAAS